MTSNSAPANVIRKHKASLLSLDHHLHKKLVIECADGRMVRGVLEGYDSNMNIILNHSVIVHQDATNPFSPQITAQSKEVCRALGAVVVRGANVVSVYAADGSMLVVNDDPLAK